MLKRPQTAPVQVASGTVEEMVRPGIYPADGGSWWLARLPGRLVVLLTLMTVPVRAFAVALDIAVSLCVLSVVGTGWAWWTQRITDEQVAEVLGTLGERLLGILSKTGVL